MKRTFGICAGIIAAGLLVAHAPRLLALGQNVTGTIHMGGGGGGGLQITVPSACINAFQGVALACNLSVRNQSGTATFAKVSGAFPLGIADVTSTGAIAGTPTVTTQGCEVVQATDGSGRTGPPTSVCITPGSLASMTVNNANQQIGTLGTLQMQAIGLWNVPSGTTTLDMTTLVTWTCPTAGNPGCGSVSASGLFTASGVSGAADPTATFTGSGTVSGSVTVTVTASSPAFQTMAVPNGQINQAYPEGSGAGFQLLLTGGAGPPYTCSLGTLSLPGAMTLSSTCLLSGTPTASGTFTGTIIGKDSALASTTLTLTGSPGNGLLIASLPNTGVAVTPATPTIAPGAQQQFVCTATYSDSSTAPCPPGAGGTVSWQYVQGNGASNASASATVAVQLNNPLAAGDSNFCAFFDANGGIANTLSSVKDQGGNTYNLTTHSPFAWASGIGEGGIAYFFTPPSGTTQVTATWVSSESAGQLSIGCDEAKPNGNAPAFDKDTVPAINQGPATTISLPAITPTAAGEFLYALGLHFNAVTAAGPPWTIGSGGVFNAVGTEYILSSPATATNVNFAATPQGVYSAIAAAFSIPGSGIWQETDVTGKSVATISPSGLAIAGPSAGTATIRATVGTATGTATLTVTPGSAPTLKSLAITPPSASTTFGNSQAFNLTATYSDASTSTVTSSAKWASSNSSIAMNGNTATCPASGSNLSSTISAQYGGLTATASFSCFGVSSSALLTGCTVSATNTINAPCSVPAGWTPIAVEGFDSGTAKNVTLGAGTSVTNVRFHTGSFSATGNINSQGAGPSLFSGNGSFQNVYLSYWEWKDCNASMNDEHFIADIRHVVSGALQQEIIADRFNSNGSGGFAFNSAFAQPVIEPQGNHFGNLFGSLPAYGVCGWHQWEVFYHFNTSGNADGIVQIFLDGQAVLNRSGVNVNGTINMANSVVQLNGNYGKSVWTNNGQRPNAGGTCSAAPGTTESGFWIGAFNAASLNAGNCAPAPPTFNVGIDDVIIIGK